MVYTNARQNGYLSKDQAKLLEKFYTSGGDITSDDLQDLLRLFGGADLWKTNNGIIWKPVTLNGFDNSDNHGFRTMKSTPDALFVGASNPWQGLEVFGGKDKDKDKNKN